MEESGENWGTERSLEKEETRKRNQGITHGIVSKVFSNSISFVIWCSIFKVKFSFSPYKLYELLHFIYTRSGDDSSKHGFGTLPNTLISKILSLIKK